MAEAAVHIDAGAVAALLRNPAGPVGIMLARRGERVRNAVAGRTHAAWYRPTLGAVRPGPHGLEVEVSLHRTRAHIIRPRSGQFLRFEVNGQTVFARIVHHPGSKPPAHYLREALPLAL